MSLARGWVKCSLNEGGSGSEQRQSVPQKLWNAQIKGRTVSASKQNLIIVVRAITLKLLYFWEGNDSVISGTI